MIGISLWKVKKEVQKERPSAAAMLSYFQRSIPSVQNPPLLPQNFKKMKNWPVLLKEGAWHSCTGGLGGPYFDNSHLRKQCVQAPAWAGALNSALPQTSHWKCALTAYDNVAPFQQ
jgi:hypothetical protein